MQIAVWRVQEQEQEDLNWSSNSSEEELLDSHQAEHSSGQGQRNQPELGHGTPESPEEPKAQGKKESISDSCESKKDGVTAGVSMFMSRS